MDIQNEQVQEEVIVQEEEFTPEETLEIEEETPEETVTLTKSEYQKMHRQSLAYKATKDTPQPKESAYQVTPDTLERIELRQDGYSKEEVDSIMELGGSKALKNPLIKTAIEAMRSKAKSQDSNQPLNSKSPVYKKFTQEDLKGMTSKELEAILPRD